MAQLKEAFANAGIGGEVNCTGPKCDYCQAPAELVMGNVIYPHRHDLYKKKFWRCKPCGAHVGCHPPGVFTGGRDDKPLGRLANAELRKLKSAAHDAFDPLWKVPDRGGFYPPMHRSEAYSWLAGSLGLPVEKTHIGMFDEDTCKRVIDLSSALFKSKSVVNGAPK